MSADAVTRYKNARFMERRTVPCRYCDHPLARAQATVEHLTPISRGGTNARHNLDISCRRCNTNKGNLTDEEFLAQSPEVRFRKRRYPRKTADEKRVARITRLTGDPAFAAEIQARTAPKKSKRKQPPHPSWGTPGVSECPPTSTTTATSSSPT